MNDERCIKLYYAYLAKELDNKINEMCCDEYALDYWWTYGVPNGTITIDEYMDVCSNNEEYQELLKEYYTCIELDESGEW